MRFYYSHSPLPSVACPLPSLQRRQPRNCLSSFLLAASPTWKPHRQRFLASRLHIKVFRRQHCDPIFVSQPSPNVRLPVAVPRLESNGAPQVFVRTSQNPSPSSPSCPPQPLSFPSRCVKRLQIFQMPRWQFPTFMIRTPIRLVPRDLLYSFNGGYC